MRNVNKFSPIMLAVSLVFAAAAAQAATVVYDGGTPDQLNGYFADTNFTYSAAATRFDLASATQFDGMTWWGNSVAAPGATSFSAAIYADGGGTPGMLLIGLTLASLAETSTGQLMFGYPETRYDGQFSGGPIVLGAGSYYMSLSATHPGTDTWFWETTSNGPLLGGASYFSPSTSWQSYPDENLAFQLTAVPEPETWGMLLAGLGVLGALKRRRAGR